MPTVAVAPAAELAPIESLPEEKTEVVPDSEAVSETASGEISAEPEASGGRKPPDVAAESGGLRPPLAKETETLPIPGWLTATCVIWLAGALAWYALASIAFAAFAVSCVTRPRRRNRCDSGRNGWPKRSDCGVVPASGWSPAAWRRCCGRRGAGRAFSSRPISSIKSAWNSRTRCWCMSWLTYAGAIIGCAVGIRRGRPVLVESGSLVRPA